MPNTVPNDYNPYAGCHKYEQLIKENQALKEENKNVIRVLNVVRKDNKQLKEQLDTLDQECASRMNKEQESEQDEIITKLCDVIRSLVPDPHADALIDEVYNEIQ